MSERINIWGKPGCELPDGKLCNACCILPEIELEGNLTSVKKQGFTECPYLSKDGQGCSLHKTGDKPGACAWHCSQADLNHKLELVSQTLSSGKISKEDVDLSVMNLLKGLKRSVSLSLILDDVYLYSENIKTKTMPRELIYGDLDEP